MTHIKYLLAGKRAIHGDAFFRWFLLLFSDKEMSLL
jgi:hypothetical protein